MSGYDHKKIENKWQDKWQKDNLYVTEDKVKGKDNFYCLVEFPYPSGNLHVGHWYAFSITDIYARLKSLQGLNVMFPIGFDAFGLPAENAAIKHNLNPRDWTYKNMDTMKTQLRSMGASFDWSKELATCDPSYYKWTQWLFLELFKKGLAYQANGSVNWCPSCKTVLANEQVVSGACERCGTEVEKKEMNQWMIKITDYADRLIDDLDELNWPEEIKQSQKNWIGRSQGAEIDFPVSGMDSSIKAFTTRPDTLFGVTYMVLAPEHEFVKRLLENKNPNPALHDGLEEVEKYVKDSLKKKELERLADTNNKTGVELKGIKAINPANKEEIPIYVADYVLGGYGTGAIMAVPAHDERDNQFAEKFNLPIKNVIENDVLINSDKFNGLSSEEAKEKITKEVGGKLTNNYKLRDWLISRQRYWGCPIPIIHCKKCGAIPVPEKDLPIELPEIDNYLPRDDGKSPLAKADDWVKVKCPTCNEDAERETDTLDTFVDSSWYFLRYTDPKNTEEFASKDKMKEWMPVDFYSGGAEHTTMHLLYSRFFNKALFDLGLAKDSEPYKERLNRGLIIGTDGNKMSKSKGNVIDPDEIVERLGADTVRLYLSFIGPYNEAGQYPWDPNGVVGVRRFLERVWKLSSNLSDSTETDPELKKELHKSIKKITENANKLKFNTCISQMMIFMNLAEKSNLSNISKEDFGIFLQLLAPFAPHIAEELWSLNNKESIFLSNWPKYDEGLVVDDEVTLAIQINGKVRGQVTVPHDISEEELKELVLKKEEISKWLEDKEVKKFIYVEGKLISVVVG